MSYAIIRTGGKQFRIEPDMTLRVPTIENDVNAQIELESLFVAKGDEILLGTPIVSGIPIIATILSHGRGEKIIVFKKKRRKQYKRKQGHRQGYTEIKIDSIG
ncbi:MAG: 50S ribosomal protein L21 [Pyrinomonadaceae bacterium]|nr:50S ribosomal protein L21 [Pyrinomonadaceae bacterium]